MSIYIDSANLGELEKACSYDWIKGITTNPTLLANEKRPVDSILKDLRKFNKDRIYYQLFADSVELMCAEAEKAADILGKKLVLKIPPSRLGFSALSRLASQYFCSVTALYDVSQAICAIESGAKEVIVYVNRAQKLMGDGIRLVREFSELTKGRPVSVLSASLKSQQEVSQAFLAGTDHVTVPYAIVNTLAMHEYSEMAVSQFMQTGIGLTVA